MQAYSVGRGLKRQCSCRKTVLVGGERDSVVGREFERPFSCRQTVLVGG